VNGVLAFRSSIVVMLSDALGAPNSGVFCIFLSLLKGASAHKGKDAFPYGFWIPNSVLLGH